MCNIRERKLMRKGRTAIHKEEKSKDLQEGLRIEKPWDVKKKMMKRISLNMTKYSICRERYCENCSEF